MLPLPNLALEFGWSCKQCVRPTGEIYCGVHAGDFQHLFTRSVLDRSPTTSGRTTFIVQDFFYRRAVASCCRGLLWCCFGPCHRHEDGQDDDGDVDDSTLQADGAAHGSSSLNSSTDVDLTDQTEKGTNMNIAFASETPFRTPRKSVAALYATPYRSVRQERSSSAPARPARPDRKASVARHASKRSAITSSCSRKIITKKFPEIDTAAVSVRRQRAFVGRIRTNGRRVRRRLR